jgi:predicted acyl esterase
MTSSDLGSEKKYTMTEERDVMIPMRDGVKVAVDIFRPDDGGKFPALLAMSPYSKGIQSLPIAIQPDRSPIHHTDGSW